MQGSDDLFIKVWRGSGQPLIRSWLHADKNNKHLRRTVRLLTIFARVSGCQCCVIDGVLSREACGFWL